MSTLHRRRPKIKISVPELLGNEEMDILREAFVKIYGNIELTINVQRVVITIFCQAEGNN